jgi:copper homeostasis protein
MNRKPLLEICVETLQAAIAAAAGGADRIELCQQLCVGGVTPHAKLLRQVRNAVEIPVFSMIRPRGGKFDFSPGEFEQMKADLQTARAEGMNGLVLGILTEDREVDVARTGELVNLAGPLPVTFHRAFDDTPDLLSALQSVIASGAARILTSGGSADAVAGSENLSALLCAAGTRITVMPGGGIRPENIREIAHATGATEFHSGLSHLRANGEMNLTAFEAAVRQLAAELA